MNYRHAFEASSLIVSRCKQNGLFFRDGVERAMALAATEAKSMSEAVDAMHATLKAYESSIRFPWLNAPTLREIMDRARRKPSNVWSFPGASF